MTSKYFIYHLYQTGNVGPHNCEIVKEQPDEGFKTNKEAENYIRNAMRNKNQWIFQQKWYRFTILKIYEL